MMILMDLMISSLLSSLFVWNAISKWRPTNGRYVAMMTPPVQLHFGAFKCGHVDTTQHNTILLTEFHVEFCA